MQRATPNQLRYIRTLLKKRGIAEPPNLDARSALSASQLIAGLQDKRFSPIFDPNGRVTDWEAVRKKASYSYDRRVEPDSGSTGPNRCPTA